MSRIAKKPINVPEKVKVEIKNTSVELSGPMGKRSQALFPGIKVESKDDGLWVTRQDGDLSLSAQQGRCYREIMNAIYGVSKGFEKSLEIVGTGFRAQVAGKNLTLQLGFSHPVEYLIPEGIQVTIDKNTAVLIKGIDKQKVGEVAAEIRGLRVPDSYKGKGIRYLGEHLIRKAGKAASAAGAGAKK
ncbi:MAG: 50S ribosomal protein L6 [Elusimicrobiota bacterium]